VLRDSSIRITATILELTAETFPAHVSELAERHPELGAIVDRWGMPAFWTRKPGLDSLVKIILEQQISIAAADTIHRRLKQALGGMSARRLCEAGPERLRSLGLTRQKSRYCYELGRAIRERRLSLGGLASLGDTEAIAALVAQPGIGPWTASIYVMSALGRIDVWPPGDLALRAGVSDILRRDGAELGDTGHRWQPKRAVAARLVWHHYRQLRNSRP
jgi:DNA-3-methyladenine glycosylase II